MIPLTQPRQPWRSSTSGKAGFSLIEMLFVTTIIALLMTVASNVMRTDTQRADVNEAIENLKGLMSTARWEARSKSSFVWLCFKPTTVSGDQGLRVALFASRDGTSNATASNLIPVGQSLMLKRVALGEVGKETPARLQADYDAASVNRPGISRLGGATTTISDGGQNSFANYIVCFNPRGEASIPGLAGASFIEVLINPFLANESASAKASSLLLSQATGAVQLYR